MSPSPQYPKYLIFDIESVADPDLVAQVHFKGKVPRDEAIRLYRDELREKNGTDFIPYTFHIPISLAILKVGADLTLCNEPDKPDKPALTVLTGEPHTIVDKFWYALASNAYRDVTLVTFNGRGFDLPLLELAAFRYGLPIPQWFDSGGKSSSDPRSRYNTARHLDLCDKLTNFGATRFSGGLNLAATMLGKPGKIDVEGAMVQDLYDAGRLREIHDYCLCDVLDTYFVFLRVMLLSGRVGESNTARRREKELVASAKSWLELQRDVVAENISSACAIYLNNWGDWNDPWQAASGETL